MSSMSPRSRATQSSASGPRRFGSASSARSAKNSAWRRSSPSSSPDPAACSRAKARMGNRSRNRLPVLGVVSASTRERSTRDARRPKTSRRASGASLQIASMAVSPTDPAKTERRAKSDSFVGHEQAMTPLQRASKGVVVRPDRPTDRREQGHLLECALELRRRIGPQQRRGQLDGKRQAIEAPADLRDRREIRGLWPEIRPGRTRAVGEQPYGVVLERRRPIRSRRGRDGRSKRVDEIRQLAVDSERLAARRKHPKIGRRAHRGTDGVRGSRGHVLAVVEDEQHPTTGDDLRQCVGRGAVLRRRTTQGGQHHLGDEGVFGDRREVAESDLQAGRCA